MNTVTPRNEVDQSNVECVDTHHWRYENTDYVLGYVASECNECGDDIPNDHAGYIRDGKRANNGTGGIDELCFGCGNVITGFGD